jgi:hypothetical protein
MRYPGRVREYFWRLLGEEGMELGGTPCGGDFGECSGGRTRQEN